MLSSLPAIHRLIGCILGLLFAARATAHDFWLEPASYSPWVGQVVAVRMLVGESFSGDAVARPSVSGMHRFVLVDADSNASVTLPGHAGADPAGMFRLASPGAYVIGFHGMPNAIELPAEKFNSYLMDEGLDSVLALRAERGQLGQPAREIYSRCAKSLVRAGLASVNSRPADRALGFPLELIAERQPWLLRDGELLPVRLLYEGRPLAGALVVALHRSDLNSKVGLRSDADGRVFFPLSHDGEWLLKVVHMRPAKAGSGADWESLWASLSFAIGHDH
jgi:uncharacterized GH25 family protein